MEIRSLPNCLFFTITSPIFIRQTADSIYKCHVNSKGFLIIKIRLYTVLSWWWSSIYLEKWSLYWNGTQVLCTEVNPCCIVLLDGCVWLYRCLRRQAFGWGMVTAKWGRAIKCYVGKGFNSLFLLNLSHAESAMFLAYNASTICSITAPLHTVANYNKTWHRQLSLKMLITCSP